MASRRFCFKQSRPNGLPPIEFSYEGFDRKLSSLPEYIGMVSEDGEIGFYALDNNADAVESLRRFLRDAREEVGPHDVAVYKFSGVNP